MPPAPSIDSEPSQTVAPALPNRPSRRRWLMIGMAFIATVVVYLDRQTLSIVAPELKKQFQMTDETYGLILSAFMLAYTVVNGVSGIVIDKVGTRLGYAMCMGWWAAADLLTAFARGPVSLGLFRFLTGAGEAGNWPAAVKITTEWFSPEERALASGIFNSGGAIGALIGPPLAGWIVIEWGWPAAFAAVGVIGSIWSVVWWCIYRTPKNVLAEVSAPPPPVRELLRSKFTRFFTLSKIFMDPVWYFYIFWFPKYLSSVHHFTIQDIAKTAWIPFLTADVGNLAGGMLTKLMIRNGVEIPRARKTSVAVFALLMASAIPAVLVSSPSASIAFVSVATFGYTGYVANTLAFPADVFPKNAVASIWGLASVGSGFGGMLWMWLSGRIVDHYGYTPVFICCGILPVIAVSIVVFLIGPLRPDPKFIAIHKFQS